MFCLGCRTHSVIRVEDVGGRRVIQDEGFVEVSAQAAQVFHIAALMEHARFPEKPGPEHATLIQQVRHRVCVLMKKRRSARTG